MVAPANTPAAQVMALNKVIMRVLQHPAVVARLATEGSEPLGSTPEDFATFLRTENVKWARVVWAHRSPNLDIVSLPRSRTFAFSSVIIR
jgi:tripartite-type tricarboxylate transporter receptor subunit TctC